MSIFFNEADAQNNQFISGVFVLYWYQIARRHQTEVVANSLSSVPEQCSIEQVFSTHRLFCQGGEICLFKKKYFSRD